VREAPGSIPGQARLFFVAYFSFEKRLIFYLTQSRVACIFSKIYQRKSLSLFKIQILYIVKLSICLEANVFVLFFLKIFLNNKTIALLQSFTKQENK
jgi:hypothetical protein